MTGNDDRLDEIEKRAKMCGLMSSGSPGGVALMDVAWVIAELRDARAEIERHTDLIAEFRKREESQDRIRTRLAAELATERAKAKEANRLLLTEMSDQTISADYVAAAMVPCPRCGAKTGSPCRVRACRNGYANCTYKVCSYFKELPGPHLERAVAARLAGGRQS